MANAFTNLWAWLSANVAPLLSGITLGGVLAAIVSVVKLIKELKGSTNSNNELGKSLKEGKALREEIGKGNEETAKLAARQSELQDQIVVLDKKVSALLEISQLDMNSRKNLSDETRTAANNIASAAKYYASVEVREQIAKEAKAMADKVREVAEEVAASAEKTVAAAIPENAYHVDFGDKK